MKQRHPSTLRSRKTTQTDSALDFESPLTKYDFGRVLFDEGRFLLGKNLSVGVSGDEGGGMRGERWWKIRSFAFDLLCPSFSFVQVICRLTPEMRPNWLLK